MVNTAEKLDITPPAPTVVKDMPTGTTLTPTFKEAEPESETVKPRATKRKAKRKAAKRKASKKVAKKTRRKAAKKGTTVAKKTAKKKNRVAKKVAKKAKTGRAAGAALRKADPALKKAIVDGRVQVRILTRQLRIAGRELRQLEKKL